MIDEVSATATKERFVLGFDASCVRCSGLARNIEQVVGDQLRVVPLGSPQMQQWRRDALGEDAPWGPTLVRVRDDSVEAWTGWRMGPVLTKHLGPRSTTQVLGVLGGSLGGMPKRRPGTSRRTFVRASLGAVAGLGLLLNTSKHTAVAATDGTTLAGADVPDDAITTLTGDNLINTAIQHLQNKDTANLVEPRSFGRAGQSAVRLDDIPRASVAAATDTTGESPAGGKLEVAGHKINHPEGPQETTVFLYQHEQRLLLISTEYSKLVDGEETHVHRLHVDHEAPNGPVLKTVSRSINGGIPRPVPEEPVTTTSCDDPCGGCSSTATDCVCGAGGDKLTSQCNWAWSVDCVWSTVGCAACAPCSGWFGCAVCMVASCSNAIRTCCSSARNVCMSCRPCHT